MFFSSCNKEGEAEDFHYDYFPVEIGTYVVYDVHQIIYDLNSSDERFQIKEVIESEFEDNLGRPSLRIERYKRDSAGDDWKIKDIWYATRTNSQAEKIEENERYVKMVFPVRDYQEWDGNVYNTQSEWLYYYDSIGNSRSINGLSFNETVKVVQRENFNLIEEEFAYEIYAKGVGLIYKELIDVDYSDPSNKTGIELYQTVIEYGKEN